MRWDQVFSCYNYERLNEASSADDKPEQRKEQSLPLSQTPAKSTLEAPAKPPGGQQDIAIPPANNPSRDAQGDDLHVAPVRIVNDPLRTREVREEELGKFERTTLLYAKSTFVVTFLTLIAIVGTAIVFWDQFQEMAAQTDILAISTRQARRDSAEASIATAKQLSIATSQLRHTQRAFALDQWPYMMDTKADLSEPLIPGHEIFVNITFKNVGKSPAQNLRIYRKYGLIEITGREQDAMTRIEALFTAARKSIEQPHDQTIPPTGDLFTTVQNHIKPTKEQIDLITNQHLELAVISGVVYYDIFGGLHETQSCRILIGPDLRVWHLCETHNRMR
jgi:hypothetical protein